VDSAQQLWIAEVVDLDQSHIARIDDGAHRRNICTQAVRAGRNDVRGRGGAPPAGAGRFAA
jgi:hypothetical protein